MEIVAWALALAFGGAFFSTTKADIVDKTAIGQYTLEYYTTPYATTFFDFAFERTANQVCSDGYKIIDKTNQPGEASSSRTRWLISCEGKKL